MWQPEINVPVSFQGGFEGFVVRDSDTGQLGYFKLRVHYKEVSCSNLGKLVGITVPKSEFAIIDGKLGVISPFWGKESIDVLKYEKLYGKMPSELPMASGILTFAWWIGYGDVRDEHVMWSPSGITLIDYGDVFSWRFKNFGHLVGPAVLLKHFDPNSLKKTAETISNLTLDQISHAFSSMEFRYQDHEEKIFSERLFEEAKNICKDIRRYWERGVMDRTRYPKIAIQDRGIWLDIPWRNTVTECNHDYKLKGGVWHCSKCNFYWPLQGDPD